MIRKWKLAGENEKKIFFIFKKGKDIVQIKITLEMQNGNGTQKEHGFAGKTAENA